MRDQLFELLLRSLQDGKLPAAKVIPVLTDREEDDRPAPSLQELHDALSDYDSDAARELLELVHKKQLQACLMARGSLLSSGEINPTRDPELAHLPRALQCGWRDDSRLQVKLTELLDLIRARVVIASFGGELAEVRQAFDDMLIEQVEDLSEPWCWSALGLGAQTDSEVLRDALTCEPDCDLAGFDEAAVLRQLVECCADESDAERRRLYLDRLLNWPSRAASAGIQSVCIGPEDRWRACQILTLRFGQGALTNWKQWSRWLADEDEVFQAASRKLSQSCEGQLEELTRLKALADTRDVTVLADIDVPRDLTLDDIAIRWSRRLSHAHSITLFEHGKDLSASVSLTEVPATPPVPAEKTVEPHKVLEPSPWDEHVKPFLMDHWYMVAGLCMVLIGASLLAFYTWDRHWLFRYTLMPLLMGGFTFGFATFATWLERRTDALKSTATVLRGGAIGLVPINFMALCLLARDDALQGGDLSLRLIVIGGMAAVYLLIYGLGLRRWCRRELSELGAIHSAALICLNVLFVAGAVLLAVNPEPVRYLLVGIFYFSFIVMLISLRLFGMHAAKSGQALGRRSIWFFAATLTLCFVEVFIGLSTFFRAMPIAADFAIMILVAGWAILAVERRFLHLGLWKGHTEESFIGYALLILGMLMGMSNDYVRPIAMCLAGYFWLRQADIRKRMALSWIGLTILTLGVAAIAAVPGFPLVASWNSPGMLGLLILGMLAGVHCATRRNGQLGLSVALSQFQTLATIAVVDVAVMAQWQYRRDSQPIWTAAILLACVAILAWRTRSAQRVAWVHCCMIILVIALPYLGCFNMREPQIAGNTMVFGIGVLSLLWIGSIAWRRSPLMTQARSTVLWYLGALALSAMTLRVFVEKAENLGGIHQAMDESGPILMAIALVFATWYSRSLVPAMMASAILAILMPELKAQYRDIADSLGYGSGLGSAGAALAVIAACFPLGIWKRLRNLAAGDAFMVDRPFPLRRHDATLFTLPLALTALFLASKVSSWNLFRNLWEATNTSTPRLSELLTVAISAKSCAALLLAAITWLLLALYFRRHQFAVVFGLLSTPLAGAGFYWFSLRSSNSSLQWPLIGVFAWVLLVLLVARSQTRRWGYLKDLIVVPYRRLLGAGSLTAAIGVVAVLTFVTGVNRVDCLLLVLLGIIAYLGGSSQRYRFGFAAYALVLAGAVGITVQGTLLEAIREPVALTAALLVVLSMEAGMLATELRMKIRRGLVFLLRPALWCSTLVSVLVLSMWALALLMNDVDGRFTPVGLAMLLAALLLLARRNRSTILGYAACVFVYGSVVPSGTGWGHLAELLMPWRLAALALGGLLFAAMIRLWPKRYERIVQGPEPLFKAGPRLRGLYPLLPFLLALFATFIHCLYFLHDKGVAEQLAATYLSSAVVLLVYWIWRKNFFLYLSILLEILANIHVARFLYLTFRDYTEGLSVYHVLAFALVLGVFQQMLKQGVISRLAGVSTNRWRELKNDYYAQLMLGFVEGLRERMTYLRRVLSASRQVFVMGILGLLTISYISHPDVTTISWTRYLASGTMALIAGLYSRSCARKKGHGLSSIYLVSMYHYGLAIALWCTALLFPPLRQPELSMLVLLLPPVFFWLRAEFSRQYRSGVSSQYRTSASIFIAILWTLYLVQPVLQLVLYPKAAAATLDLGFEYHRNAAWIFASCFLALRLRGLGTRWLSSLAGGVGIFSLYMLVTFWSWPMVSPFENRVPAAFVGILLGHALIALTMQRSPLRTWIQQMADMSDAIWHQERREWGMAMLLGVHALLLLAIQHYQTAPLMMLPLLLFCASLLVHQVWVSGRPFWVYPAIVEVLLALHTGFVMDSYILPTWVVWILMGLWLLCTCLHRRIPARFNPRRVAAVLGVLAFAHIIFVQHPHTWQGLLAMAGLTALLAVMPIDLRGQRKNDTVIFAALLPLIIPWLAFFSLCSPDSLLAEWPWVATAAAFFVLAGLVRLVRRHQLGHWGIDQSDEPRLYNQTLSFVASHRSLLCQSALLIATGISLAAVTSIMLYQELEQLGLLVLLAALFGGLARGWQVIGRERHSRVAMLLAEASAVGAMFCCRHIFWHLGAWNKFYDVWALLAITFILSALKNTVASRWEEERRPLTWTICALPIISLALVVFRGLGTDMALLVLGLNSLIFCYLGRERRDSPYNAAAVAGFVAFLITLVADLKLNVLHAYIIPVGLGVLALLQLFGRELRPEVRNRIRLVTLLAMLGSSGWYALLDPSFPLIFNLIMLALCLLAMGLGSFLQIRLYVLLGFTGLLVDLGSLLYKGIRQLEKGYQMASIGVLLLTLGAAVVVGAAWYKVNRDKVDRWLDQWRKRLSCWE